MQFTSSSALRAAGQPRPFSSLSGPTGGLTAAGPTRRSGPLRWGWHGQGKGSTGGRPGPGGHWGKVCVCVGGRPKLPAAHPLPGNHVLRGTPAWTGLVTTEVYCRHFLPPVPARGGTGGWQD